MSFSLLLLLAIWALPCPVARLPTTPADIVVDLLLLQRNLVAVLALGTAADNCRPPK